MLAGIGFRLKAQGCDPKAYILISTQNYAIKISFARKLKYFNLFS